MYCVDFIIEKAEFSPPLSYECNRVSIFHIFHIFTKTKSPKPYKIKGLRLSNRAADRNRTGTGITTHGILSPGRLPVPPLRHMDGDGFEPSKQFAADLQSVPFGHSGIRPCILFCVRMTSDIE